MNIAIIGAGYVGLVSGACFSEFGFQVTCIDTDARKITALREGRIPIYEPGLDDLVARNIAAGRLHFDTEMNTAVAAADIVFIAVGTPARRGDGHADLDYVHAAAAAIAGHLTGYTLVVTKSTVPVGTGRAVERILQNANPGAEMDVVSNPEFLREGSAISDFMRPDRVVVGAESDRARGLMAQLYRPLDLIETPILFTSLETAELIKYAANAFLAVKISYINQMADLCEAVGADVHDVARGMGLDQRIGPKFLQPGPGYGGSCFPKDTLALVKTARDQGRPVSLVEQVVAYNDARKQAMAARVIAAAGGSVKGREIAILGLAFKPDTDDVRDSPALAIIPALLAAGAKVRAYDPAASAQAKPLLPAGVRYAETAADCISGADITVIITEWTEFRALTPEVIAAAMKGNTLVDLRNILNPAKATAAGLDYTGVGRGGGGKRAKKEPA